jgi:SAM-dependent methyltransferase
MTAARDWWQTFFTGPMADGWLRAMPEETTQQEADFVEQVLQVAAPARLLDVPCGGGRHAHALAARGYQMTAVDVSPHFLAAARARPVGGTGQVAWEQRDMRDLPWAGAFDGAYSMGNSFGYLDDQGNADFLSAVARALKPGGRFVLDTGCHRQGVTDLPELGRHPLPQDGAERLQGRPIAPALAAHQVERPLDAQPGDRQHDQGARGAFRPHRQPRHDGQAHAFGHHPLDGLGAAQRHDYPDGQLQPRQRPLFHRPCS